MSGTVKPLFSQLPRSWNKLDKNPSNNYSDYYDNPMEYWSSINTQKTLDPRRGMNNSKNMYNQLPRSWNKLEDNTFNDYYNISMEDWSAINNKRTSLDPRRGMNNIENIYNQLPRSWNKLEENTFNDYSDYDDPMNYWSMFNKKLKQNRVSILNNVNGEVPMNNISKEAYAWGSTLPSLLLKYGIPGLLTGGLIYGGYKVYDWWNNKKQSPVNSVYDLYRNYYQYSNPYVIQSITNNHKPKIQVEAGVNTTSKELSNDVEDTTPTNITLTPADAETKAKIRRLARNQ